MFKRKFTVSFMILFLLTVIAGNPAFAMDRRSIVNMKNTGIPMIM